SSVCVPNGVPFTLTDTCRAGDPLDVMIFPVSTVCLPTCVYPKYDPDKANKNKTVNCLINLIVWNIKTLINFQTPSSDTMKMLMIRIHNLHTMQGFYEVMPRPVGHKRNRSITVRMEGLMPAIG